MILAMLPGSRYSTSVEYREPFARGSRSVVLTEKSMVTIHDIAQQTGVSPNTVARILSGRKGRPYNEEKVFRAAKELGYVRNLTASSLRSGRSGYIGLLVPEIRNPNYTDFFQHLQNAAFPLGYQILVFSSGGKALQERKALELMEQSRADAIILNASEGDSDEACDPVIGRLIRRKVPVVLAGRPERRLHTDEIIVRNSDGMRKVVQYLVRTGRRHIAFICGGSNVLASVERLEGYRNGLERAGLPWNPSIVKNGEFTLESGVEMANQLLQHAPECDAIVAANDLLAIGAIYAVQAAGRRVPEDVAVSGCDDIPFASKMHPLLTTLRQPREVMASDVIDLVTSRIADNGPAETCRLVYDLDLIIRESA